MACETQNVDIVFNDTTAQDVRFDDTTALALTFNDTVNQNIQCAAFEATADYYTDVVAATLGAANIVSHYRLDETSGTTAADVKGTNDGTYTNGPTLNQTSLIASGSGGGTSVDFDGINDYVDLGATGDYDFITGTGVFTIAAWVFWDGTSGFQSVIGTDFSSAAGGFELRLDGANNRLQGIWDSGGTTRLSNASGLSGSGIYHCAFVGDGDSVQVYLNAVAGFDDAFASTTVDPLPNLYIGSNDGSTRFFADRIDEVTIANVAASAADVTALYNGGT